MRNFKRLAAIVLASLAVMQFAGSPAHAAAASGVVGTGTVTPGIPGPLDPPASNTFTFSGTMAGVFGTTAGTCNVAFSGSGVDTLATGSANGSYTCNGTGISLGCNASVSRTGAVMTVQGNCSGTVSGTVIWVCVWVATSWPITSYAWVCATVII